AYRYDDYISYREKKLATSSLDAKGNFNLSFPATRTTSIFLMIDNAKAEMTVEPGKTYDIHFFAKDSDAVNTLSLAVPVELEFNNSGDSELNFLIADFSNRYETFLQDYRGMISKKDNSIFGKIDTLKTLMKKKYSAFQNPYLDNFITFQFASLEENLALGVKEKVFDRYLRNFPIQLDNSDYMAFFHQFYSSVTDFFMKNEKTSNEINNQQNFASLMDFFKQNKFLANDTLREMTVLKSIADYAHNPAFKSKAMLLILEQASKQCKVAENRKAAANLYKKLNVMTTGNPAPSMEFINEKGKNVSLADYTGKYVYLNFWASWCSSCTQEMSLLPDLKKQYGGRIVFVSISVDKNMDAMKNFLKKNSKSDWIFLYCNDYKKAKEEFNVLTVPTYYLIDPKGNVMLSPAPGPVDIEPTFNQIKKKKQ
ncbi:MAG TPA: TlpA disulfide reductase family protein, partial [Bacteroidia bacterium]